MISERLFLKSVVFVCNSSMCTLKALALLTKPRSQACVTSSHSGVYVHPIERLDFTISFLAAAVGH